MLKKRTRVNSVSSNQEVTKPIKKMRKSSKNDNELQAKLKPEAAEEEIIINAGEDQDDFKQLGISEHIANKLKEKSILSLFEVQKKVFPPVASGKNIIVASLTGSGKTLSFVLPLITMHKESFKQQKPVILVMAPTRELSIQVGREFSDLSSEQYKYKTVMVYGGVSIEDQIYKLRAGCDIVVGTPGRIMDMIERKELVLKNVKSVVLDEADKMLTMGFQEQIEDIFGHIHQSRRKTQVCLFSATIESWVKQVANNIMINKHDDSENKVKDAEAVFVDLVKDLGGRTPKTVQHLAVNSLKSDKVTTIADLILCYGGKNKATIVFVNTKRECNDLMISDKIKQEVQIIHGDINQKQREATIEGFKKGKYKCLVATDVASRGLDIPMVDLVIQSEPPKEIDTYIHRAGRTARAGRSGVCITMFTKFTEGLLTRIEQKAKFKFKKIGAPQKKEIIDSSIRDIKYSIAGLDDNITKHFTDSANQLIDEFGAVNAVSRLFAYVSGLTENIKSRSLLVGAEGFITYQIKYNSTFNHIGYVWSMLKRVIPEDVKGKVRGLKVFKSMDGCVFDYPEDGHTIFEEIMFNDKLHGINYTLTKAEELPELLEAENVYGSNNNNSSNSRFGGGYNNNNNSFGGNSNGGYGRNNNFNSRDGNSRRDGSGSGTRSFSANAGSSSRSSGGNFNNRTDRLDIFIGNLSSGADSNSVVNFLQANRIDTSDVDVRLVNDRDTGSFKGFGFISCFDKEKYANILQLTGKMINGRSVRINDASEKKQ